MSCCRQVFFREGGRKNPGQRWPLLLAALSRSISAGSSISLEDDEQWRRAAIAHQTRRLTNAVTVDAAQRTADAVLELENAKDIIRTSTEQLARPQFPANQLVCPPLQCTVAPTALLPPTTQPVYQQALPPALLQDPPALDQYQRAYLTEGPGAAQQEATLYANQGSGVYLAYGGAQTQPPPIGSAPLPQAFAQPALMTWASIAVPQPTQFVQPALQTLQLPQQVMQPALQTLQLPQQVIQPQVQVAQTPAPMLPAQYPAAIAPMTCALQCFYTPQTTYPQPLAYSTGLLGSQINELVTDAMNRHSLQILRSSAEEAAKNATEELKRIPMETADSFAKIERQEDRLLMDPYYDPDDEEYDPRYSRYYDDDEEYDYDPHTMHRSR